MKPAKNLKLSVPPSKQSEFDKDIWDCRKLGVDTTVIADYNIKFLTISQPWLRQAAKQYIKYTFGI